MMTCFQVWGARRTFPGSKPSTPMAPQMSGLDRAADLSIGWLQIVRSSMTVFWMCLAALLLSAADEA